MVKKVLLVLSLFIVTNCSHKDLNNNQVVVFFEEHKITIDEKQRVEESIRGLEKFFGDSLFDRDGIYLEYATHCDVCNITTYMYYIGEDNATIDACYLEEVIVSGEKYYKKVSKCAQIDIHEKIFFRLQSIDFSQMPVVVAKSKNRNNAMFGSPRIYVMKKKGADKQFVLLYNPRHCLKRVCQKNDQTEVPERYMDNAFLFDMVNYLMYEIAYYEGLITKDVRDSAYHAAFE